MEKDEKIVFNCKSNSNINKNISYSVFLCKKLIILLVCGSFSVIQIPCTLNKDCSICQVTNVYTLIAGLIGN